MFVLVITPTFHLLIMTSLSSSTHYLCSTLAYPNLKQMLDSLLSAAFFSTSSTLTLPTSTVISTPWSANTISSSSPLPPISSVLPSANQFTTSLPLPLQLHGAFATSAHLQHFSAVRELIRDLQH